MSSGTEWPGQRPERRPYGRLAPPPGYPNEKELYADPENWTYPLNSAVRARLARRYFNDERNRSKYTEEERRYIDARIDDALHRFGFEVTSLSQAGSESLRKTGAPISAKKLEQATTSDLLLHFLGRARLERAKEIDPSLVRIEFISGDQVKAKIKDYTVEIDLQERIIRHNCPDWEKWTTQKMMCKHVGRLFLTLDEQISTPLLRQIYTEKESWEFTQVN